MKRLWIYLAATFAISWGCWWTLTREMTPGDTVLASGLSATLYLVGGFGPTIGAVLAVVATPRDGSLSEYGSRLLRWKVGLFWWLAVVATPLVFAAGKEWVAIWAGGASVHPADLAPLKRVAILFPTMIIGGGLEELGWRGVAQPLVEQRMPRLVAALVVGVIWALWHLPLFQIPGAAQFGRNFALFAADVLANACLLAWVYAGARSILLCVVFHAASNTVTALGVLAIGPPAAAAWIAVALKLIAAAVLLASLRGLARDQPART
jgi:membrane protease YdiL (CAAX protease family)